MHPFHNATQFFAVVGAPYIPEGHLDECYGEGREHSFRTAESDQACPQATRATAWWPRIRQ